MTTTTTHATGGRLRAALAVSPAGDHDAWAAEVRADLETLISVAARYPDARIYVTAGLRAAASAAVVRAELSV